MFSYLRSNNRRSAFPSTPNPYTSSTRNVYSLHGSTEDLSLKHTYHPPEYFNPSPISPDPPVLPPIPRVASQHEPSRSRDVESLTIQEEYAHPGDGDQEEARMQAFQSSTHGEHPTLRKIEDEQHPTISRTAVMSPPSVPLQQNLQFQNRQLRPPHAASSSMRSYSEPFAKQTRIGTHEQAERGFEGLRAPPPGPLKLSLGPGASAAPGRQGKTRLHLPNLRNPMSLLARRRSHQAVAEANNEKAQYKGAYPPVPGLPDDFDPRIRGHVVHDFSAPRPGTNKSSNSARDLDRSQREAILYSSRRASPDPSTSCIDDESPSSGEREHTPQFKEHFEDDFGPFKDGPAKKRTSAFMYQVSLSESQPDPDRSALPPFARHLPSNITTAASPAPKVSSPSPNKSLEIVPETRSTNVVSTDNFLPSTPPTSPPVKPRSRATSNTDSPYQPTGLPKHFKSNASRFSFDLAGVGSAAQEKLLEEKHRKSERRKARRSDDSEAGIADDDDEYLDEYNDLDVYDGLEEKIPGVNADAEEPTILDAHHRMQDVDFISPNKSSFTSAPSLASTGLTSPNTPRDSMGQPVNLAGHQMSPGLVRAQDNCVLESYSNDMFASTKGVGGHVSHEADSDEENDNDDLYFDDGIIEDLEVQENHPFDESVFDDDTSRVYGVPLRDQKLSERTVDALHQQQHGNVINHMAGPLTDAPLQSSNSLVMPAESFQQLDRRSRSSVSQPGGLANLAAYHDALAVKVNQAALNGEFVRRPSLGTFSEDVSDNNAGPPQAPFPSNGIDGEQAGGLLVNDGIVHPDDLEFDDALADDSIIAAANAEALENDDEGFYGQEFGFFAKASGSGEAEYANGGYFGSRGLEGIGRSHSGRVNEPSLTPITERSEWSNRNSAISLAMHAFPPSSAGPQPSPGLAQLADMMHLEEDDMSLSALMKLRRGTWGGSNASLHSSSSGSPLAYVPGVGFPAAIPMQQSNSSNGNVDFANSSPLAMQSAHNFASSSYSLNSSNGLASSNEDSSPSPASATITFSSQQQALPIQQPPQSAPAFLPQQQQLQQSIPVLSPPFINLSQQPQRRSLSPIKRSSMGPPPKPSKGHSRNGSSTSESVSYVLEAASEDGGQGRWVLEKRRMDESGVVEVLRREVVEGGRI
ncbi:MAG: hypothetical protein Q9225_000550 [Loekoesia sp. 1 TL-2023]